MLGSRGYSKSRWAKPLRVSHEVRQKVARSMSEASTRALELGKVGPSPSGAPQQLCDLGEDTRCLSTSAFLFA